MKIGDYETHPAADLFPAEAGARAQRWAGTEPDEATVTFVRREPLLPSVEKPKAPPTAPATGLFARLRTIADEPQAAPQTPNEAFAAPGGAEEAEVVIRTSESAEAQREAGARAGTGGRLRKTLPGG
jgi:hypothetical protein